MTSPSGVSSGSAVQVTATKVCFDVLPQIRNLQGTESLSRGEVRNLTEQVINSLRLTFADEIRRLLETRTVPVASVEPVRWVESIRRPDTELSVRLAPGARTFDVTALQHRLDRGKSRADSPFFDEATRIVRQYYGSMPLAYRGEGMRLETLPAAWQAVHFVTAHLEDADPEDLAAARESAADLALAMSALLPPELARVLGGAPALVQTTHQDIVRVTEQVAARGAQGLSPLLRTSIPNQSDLPPWMNRRFGLEIEFHARDESVRESLKLIETVTENASNIDTPEAWEEAVQRLQESGLDVPENNDDPLDNLIALQEEMGEREDGPAFAMLEELRSRGFTNEQQIGDYHTAYNRGYREASDAWSFERDTAMFEIVSPILRTSSETWDQIDAVIGTIQRYGGRVDTLTGGHIHLDIADFGTSVAVHQAFISIVQTHQDVLYRLGTNPWSRTGHRGYRAASPLTQPAPGYVNLAQIRTDFHHDKLINFESVHGTLSDHLEFRVPDESLNPQVKQVLVTLLQAMADLAFRVAANPGLLASDVIEAPGSHRDLQQSITSTFHDSADREWRLYESDSPESTTSLLRLLNLLPLSPEQRDEVLALWSITPWPLARQTLGRAPTEPHALSNAGPSRLSEATEEVHEPVGVVGGGVSYESGLRSAVDRALRGMGEGARLDDAEFEAARSVAEGRVSGAVWGRMALGERADHVAYAHRGLPVPRMRGGAPWPNWLTSGSSSASSAAASSSSGSSTGVVQTRGLPVGKFFFANLSTHEPIFIGKAAALASILSLHQGIQQYLAGRPTRIILEKRLADSPAEIIPSPEGPQITLAAY
ncbi:hypothetical protein FNH09_05290 [Streptomyces adustus]|uniref:Uncharacterized protein n=1 Tax=Streptomyces adustus TaxID=1609272 RepID=A0A5N8V6G4_9ACTN|nr:hypothetical protein [Streptomyces adustus]